MNGDRSRAQVVLLAAAVVALALVPILMAYVQLGYRADATASEGYTDPTRDAERALERAVADAARDVPLRYGWDERRDAVRTVRERLAPRLETIRESRVQRGTVYRVSYNETVARTVASERCPGGPGRQFGPCRARDGIVIQERAGDAHVLAAVFDLTVTTERGRIHETVVVRTVGGVARR